VPCLFLCLLVVGSVVGVGVGLQGVTMQTFIGSLFVSMLVVSVFVDVGVGLQGGTTQALVGSTPAPSASETPAPAPATPSLPIPTAAILQSVVSSPVRGRLAFKTLLVFSLQTARMPTFKFQPARTTTARSTFPSLLPETQSAANLAHLSILQVAPGDSLYIPMS
jgi:hypothetical protein